MAAPCRLLSWLTLSVLLAGPALAQQTVVYKHDQFSDNIVDAANQIAGQSVSVQPGFAQGEAWGQVYRPQPTDYPVKILGVDMVMAGPPNQAGTAEANGVIEIWAFDNGPQPVGNAPLWSVQTQDLYDPNTSTYGIPLTGDVAWSVDFDYSDPLNHPPLINSGNFAVIIRFADPAQDLQAEWGTMQCAYYPGLGACGCQDVSPILDQATTQQANLMHVLASGCSPPATVWNWANVIGVNGDFVLRARAEVGECTPDCTDACCGDDGCGGQCPDNCGDGWVCNQDNCTCETLACNDGEVRCNGDQVEECVGGVWQAGEDCAASGEVCVDGQCQACQPDCADACCGADGCGGTCPDTCPDGSVCNQDSCACEAPDCVHGDLRCSGDQVEECVGGLWQAGEDCAASDQVCVDGQCQACQPDCADACCGADGCGGTCPDTCPDGSVCNQDSCACEAPECTHGDLRCSGDQVEECVGGLWQAGEDCADSGQTCQAGACVDEPATLGIEAITPDFGYNDQATDVSITGQGFQAGASGRLGGDDLESVEVVSAGLITASVPAGMEPGSYMLIVVNPGGDTASLADAFEVRLRDSPDGGGGGDEDEPAPSSGCGCSAAGSAGGAGAAWLLLFSLAVLVRRRRS